MKQQANENRAELHKAKEKYGKNVYVCVCEKERVRRRERQREMTLACHSEYCIRCTIGLTQRERPELVQCGRGNNILQGFPSELPSHTPSSVRDRVRGFVGMVPVGARGWLIHYA